MILLIRWDGGPQEGRHRARRRRAAPVVFPLEAPAQRCRGDHRTRPARGVIRRHRRDIQWEHLNKRRVGTFNDKQSQITERKTGDGRGPGDHSSEAG